MATLPSPSPLLLRDPEAVAAQVGRWRGGGERVGFVPTMGALHAGHLSLLEEARKSCGRTVVSIFVNPTQFSAGEDYSRYPRRVDEDVDLLSRHGCDLVWLPDIHHIYPEGFATRVCVDARLTGILCGAHRSGHFDGVATVVSVLLNAVRPEVCCFGEKDYQQLQVIRRMHRDLRLPGAILAVPTAREADGLAFSSRNRYLTARERGIAPQLHATLKWIRAETEERAAAEVLEEAAERLIRAGFNRLDYLEIRHETTLELLTGNLSEGRIFAAAWLGDTRLIDNHPLHEFHRMRGG